MLICPEISTWSAYLSAVDLLSDQGQSLALPPSGLNKTVLMESVISDHLLYTSSGFAGVVI